MLESDKKSEPNAIEQYFCKEFEKVMQDRSLLREMDLEETEILLTLLNSTPIKINEVDKKDKPFIYQLIEKRIQHCLTFVVNDARLILFLGMVAESAGKAVMYLTYLQYVCKQKNIKELSFKEFINIFGYGFPKDETLYIIWDKQKVKGDGSDNLLDYQSAMKSIQFEILK